MRLESHLHTGSSLALAALYACVLLPGCSLEPDDARTPQRRAAAGSAGTSVGSADAARSALPPSASAPPHPAYAAVADDTVLLKLDQLPRSLNGKQLGDVAWSAWLQEVLGPGVTVRSARLLRGSRGRAAPGQSLVVSVAPTSEAQLREALTHASAHPGVARAELDPIWTSHGVPDDPRYAEQWNLHKVGAAQAWDTVTGAADVVVAVLDSGLDVAHDDLAGAVWTNPNEVSDGVDNDGNGQIDDLVGWDFVDGDNDVADTFGHGTHVAGIVGARANNGLGVAGIASGVRLMPLVVGGPAIRASAVAEAIYYAVDHGAHVINMSFGGPETFQGARDAIDYAVSRGVVLVASAGNGATELYNYPAVYQEVIAVASLEPSDARAVTSHYGRWIDIAAPGHAVLSTSPNDQYDVMSGTSQAAPLVAGVAALIKSAHPSWTADQIRAQLVATADAVDAHNPDYIGLLGAGRVDAAEAVGGPVGAPRAYVAGVHLAEAQGNGDQEVGAGEGASLAVTLHFGTSGAVTARLVSSDVHVSVTDGVVALQTEADRTALARFRIAVVPGAPSDHRAALTVRLQDAAGALVGELPLGVLVAPSHRHLRLPFAYDRQLLPLPDGRHVLVADDSANVEGRVHRVYASFRQADGSFTPPVVLSDTSRNARRPQALVAPNGDVHVVYYQYVAFMDFHAFAAYAHYDAASGTWTNTLLSSGASLSTQGERNVAIALDAAGTLHLAWSSLNGLVTTRRVDGQWTEQQVQPVHDQASLEVQFVETSAGLQLFAHPVLLPWTGSPTYTLPTYVLDDDGATWSAPRVLANATGDELAHLPFALDSAVHRLYQAEGTSVAALARLEPAAWVPVGPVLDLGLTNFRTGFFARVHGPAEFSAFVARHVAATQGSERELYEDGALLVLPGDRKLRATHPTFTVGSDGVRHVLSRENTIERYGTVFYEIPSFTSYYTPAPLASAALPSVPVVVDDGAITTNDRQLHASWSSTHSAGIVSYRVAWGSAPGADDIVPWFETTESEATVQLGDQRLLPGQTVYASVQARSGALLSSAIGSSDGITLPSDRCVAPAWHPTVVYQDAGVRVTYGGATYRNLYWNSHQTPGASSAWAFVSECSGEPVLPTCSAPAWTAGQQYATGTRVSHEGMEYEGLWPSLVAPDGSSGNPWKWVAACQP